MPKHIVNAEPVLDELGLPDLPLKVVGVVVAVLV